jgi:hypothetical protein
LSSQPSHLHPYDLIKLTFLSLGLLTWLPRDAPLASTSDVAGCTFLRPCAVLARLDVLLPALFWAAAVAISLNCEHDILTLCTAGVLHAVVALVPLWSVAWKARFRFCTALPPAATHVLVHPTEGEADIVLLQEQHLGEDGKELQLRFVFRLRAYIADG